MIQSVTARDANAALREEALVIPLYAGVHRLGRTASRLDRSLGGVAGKLLGASPFPAARGETRSVSVARARGLVHVVLLGLGDRGQANVEEIADAAGAGARALVSLGARSALVALDDAGPLAIEGAMHAFVKGMSLATYSYRVGKRPPSVLRKLVLMSGTPARRLGPTLVRARRVVELTERVRDWVNAPGNTLGPVRFAEEARAFLKGFGVETRVWERREIEKAGMGGVLGVAAGSREEPRFVVASYRAAERRRPLVCLVGKGVTFDSGGISIKPWDKMSEMKSDMAGGASVVAAVAAAAAAKLPVHVVGLVPCVENMPDGGALRPGDVLTLHSGKTVEVLTTDAEGRLILADAVSYASEHYRPDVIVDVATLTGGVLVALGTRIAGVMGTSARDIDALRDAGARSGEPVWPLPLDHHSFAAMKGDISDYKNYAGRAASSITAAALIGAFAGKTPWLHIDIAGSSWNDGPGPSYQTRGATGYGVDLLLSFLELVAAR